MVLKIAHRGASSIEKENSKEAFLKAIELKADVVEFDVRFYKTKIVVSHNEVKRHKDLPSIQEIINILKNRCICKIDLKDPYMENQIIEIIKQNELYDTIITSKYLYSLKKIKDRLPEIQTEIAGFEYTEPIEYIIELAKDINADIIGTHIRLTTKELVEEAHKNGLKVHVWGTNSKKNIKRMKKIGVNGITTKYPNKV